jgi:peptidoglycan/LPS O-acetylase OafA/YrhL
MISTNNHFNFFRLLFALEVVYSHSVGWLKLPLGMGGELLHKLISFFPGVPLFFMVSGFLITNSFLNSKNMFNYAKKRALRIYPGLFVNILILEIAIYLGGNLKINDISIFQYITYFFIYVFTAWSSLASRLSGIGRNDNLYNFDVGFFHDYPSGVLWTLIVEIGFYVLLPLLFMPRKERYRNILIIFISIIGMIVPIIAYQGFFKLNIFTKALEVNIIPYLWIFAIGIFANLYWSRIKNFLVDKGIYFLIIYIIYCFVVSYYGDLGNFKRYLNFWTFIQMLLLGATLFSMAFSYTNIKIFRHTDLSYATYLYHMLFIQIFISLGFIGEWKYFFVVIILALTIAYLSWNFVEKPMLKLKNVKWLKG